jgi:hypothetical protein
MIRLMNYESESVCKEEIGTFINISWYFPKGNEENHENGQNIL